MKTRKILALSMAVATMVTASTAAFAAELTPSSTTGNTEVTANIQDPGAVNYIITIPDKVDFGTLTQPETDTDSFKDVKFTVTATKIENLPDKKRVAVEVKDKDATADNDQFYITQKTSPNTKLMYCVYDTGTIGEGDSHLAEGEMSNDGYDLVYFKNQGQTLIGTIRLNQKQLYGKDIAEIAGDYSGTMVFTSSIVELNI
ncbi:MAG: hypothetical protein SOT80_10925 [Candidatus Pseudoruminococcus sp.]|nr:hypothetical protein [Ruminococcus sp.]MDY2783890.1 hypothetical protein [Candidatus Pseudoruminococcus sp.]